jgi:hypothetical protein
MEVSGVAAPEPSSWILMLAGVADLGFSPIAVGMRSPPSALNLNSPLVEGGRRTLPGWTGGRRLMTPPNWNFCTAGLSQGRRRSRSGIVIRLTFVLVLPG